MTAAACFQWNNQGFEAFKTPERPRPGAQRNRPRRWFESSQNLMIFARFRRMADLHLSSYRKHAHEPDDWLKSPIASVGIATRRAFRVESQRTLESHRLTATRRKKDGTTSNTAAARKPVISPPMQIMPVPGSATER